ncbi:hypothetical protein PR048_007722, partial [Dryococelus australis]
MGDFRENLQTSGIVYCDSHLRKSGRSHASQYFMSSSSVMVSTDMEPGSPTDVVVPERRAKSWRREHEERCSRRLQKKNGHALTAENYFQDEGVASMDSSSKCDTSDGGQSGAESSECETNSVDENPVNADYKDNKVLLTEFGLSKLTGNSTNVFSAIKNICELECNKYDGLSKDMVCLAEDSSLEGKIVDVSELESTIIRDLGNTGGVESDMYGKRTSFCDEVSYVQPEENTASVMDSNANGSSSCEPCEIPEEFNEIPEELNDSVADDCANVHLTAVDMLKGLEILEGDSNGNPPEFQVQNNINPPAAVCLYDLQCEETSEEDGTQLIEEGKKDVQVNKQINAIDNVIDCVAGNSVSAMDDTLLKESGFTELQEDFEEKLVKEQVTHEAGEVFEGKLNAVPEKVSELGGCGTANVEDPKLECGVVLTSEGDAVVLNSATGIALERLDKADLVQRELSLHGDAVVNLKDNILITVASHSALDDESDDIKCMNELEMYISEAEERLATMAKLRQINQNVANLRPDESHFTKLDSSLKKNTSFVRKL